MKKVSIVVHHEYLPRVIKKLHETGYIEIMDISQEEATSSSDQIRNLELSEKINQCENYETRLSRLITILQKEQQPAKGIKTLFTLQRPEMRLVRTRSFSELLNEIETLLKKIESSILDAEKKLSDLSLEYTTLLTTFEEVELLQFFDVDLSNFDQSNYVVISAGTTTYLPEIEQHIKNLESSEIYSHQIATGKKSRWVVLVAVHRSEQEKFERLCRDKISFFKINSLSGKPQDVLKVLAKKKNTLEEEQRRLHQMLQQLREKHISDLYAYREEVQIQKNQQEIVKHFSQTKTTYLIQGWVLEKHEDTLREIVSDAAQGYYDYISTEPSTNPDNPPTHLETPKWAEAFQMFLELFATPKYNEINPTIFMGLFLIIFFGFMLGDAGYGLIILLFSLFGVIKYGKISPTIKKWSVLGLMLGTSTIVVGLLTNSFFGDLIPRFIYHNPTQPLYTIPELGLPLEPLRDPLTILTIALFFGLIHLNFGIILGIIQAAHHKKYKEMVTRYCAWFPLQIGGGLLIGSFILGWELDTYIVYIALLLTLCGMILLFIHDGPLGFFGITGYVGDWLSYARLLALGLATSGMALAFNVIGELAGIILMPFILIIAHTANVIIQALGAGVHALRLQYVEFFNRFYEGGGRPFSPFKIKRTYTKIEEK